MNRADTPPSVKPVVDVCGTTGSTGTNISSPYLRRNKLIRADYLGKWDPCSSPARDGPSKKAKIKNIEKALYSNPVELETLKQLAISRGGLISDEIRIKAWPKLLGVDVTDIPDRPDTDVLHSHRDYEQVVLDVNRSLKRFPPGMEENVRLSMQDQLVDCIMRVLVERPELHYYQGYHDIVVTFLLVVGEDITFSLMNELSIKHLRDFMYENMDKTSGMLHYLYPLIDKASHKLHNFMTKAEVGTMFCLPWLITWYGHVLNDVRHIIRLYDFFIACHPLMPIYLAAAIVLHRETDILNCEPEMPFIHCLLSKIPDDLPFEQLIIQAGDLFVQHPPRTLQNEAKIQYEKSLEENRRKQEQISQLRNSRLVKTKRTFWPFSRGKAGNHASVLVRMTVYTGAALLSAAAVTLLNNYFSKNMDGWMDMHWLWGSH